MNPLNRRFITASGSTLEIGSRPLRGTWRMYVRTLWYTYCRGTSHCIKARFHILVSIRGRGAHKTRLSGGVFSLSVILHSLEGARKNRPLPRGGMTCERFLTHREESCFFQGYGGDSSTSTHRLGAESKRLRLVYS